MHKRTNEEMNECLAQVGSLYYRAKDSGQEELARILDIAYTSLSDAKISMNIRMLAI
jgi:hypothetical protein